MYRAIESYLTNVYENSLNLSNETEVCNFIKSQIYKPIILPIVNKHKSKILQVCNKYKNVVSIGPISDADIDSFRLGTYIMRVLFIDWNYDFNGDDNVSYDGAEAVCKVCEEVTKDIINEAKQKGVIISHDGEIMIDDTVFDMTFRISEVELKKFARNKGVEIIASATKKVTPIKRKGFNNKSYKHNYAAMEGVGLAILATFGAVLVVNGIKNKIQDTAFSIKNKAMTDTDPNPFHTMIVTPSDKGEIFRLTKNAKNDTAIKKRHEFIKNIGYTSAYGGYHKLMLVNIGDSPWMSSGYVEPNDISMAISEISDHIANASKYHYNKRDLEFFKKFLADLNKAQEEKKGLLITD